jgi:hypothetical protein
MSKQSRDTVLTIRLPKALKESIQFLSTKYDLSVSDIVILFIRKGLNSVISENSLNTFRKVIGNGN